VSPQLAIVIGVVLAASAALTGAWRRLALARGVLDWPNARSSHSAPTPRGGGIAIVFTMSAAVIALSAAGMIDSHLVIALCGGGAAVGGGGVAAAGFADDRRSVAFPTRLTVQFAAAAWAVWWLGGLPAIRIGARVTSLGWAGHLIATIGIVWTLNLFNFMDGIDGIAASEAVFVALAGGAISIAAGDPTGFAACALAAACAGFLPWNWPPARIFMGDVGSGYVGFALAVLALSATRTYGTAPWVWLILGGIFFVDATLTLLWRVARRERVHEAHRTHAYQWLARRWASHRRVTLAAILGNVIWLLPWALVAKRVPGRAGWALLAAFAPVILIVWIAGAGRPER